MLAALKALLAGLENPELPTNCTQITASGQVWTLADLITAVTAMVKLYQDEVDARKDHQDALQARDAQAPNILTQYEAIKAALKAALGRYNPHLISLGLRPDKVPTPLTVEKLQQRVAKSGATRKARGTLGKNQKKAIKGTVTPPVTTPAPVTTPTKALA